MRAGDPGFFGWLQTLLYFVAAWACFRRFRSLAVPAYGSSGAPRFWSEARLWLFIAFICLLLGVNKQLDLQTWVIEEFKQLATNLGLVGQKQRLRQAVLLTACAFVFVTGSWALSLVRRASWGLRCAMLGVVLLGPFAALRLARFSGVMGRGGRAFDVAFELLPTLLVLAGARLSAGRQPPRLR